MGRLESHDLFSETQIKVKVGISPIPLGGSRLGPLRLQSGGVLEFTPSLPPRQKEYKQVRLIQTRRPAQGWPWQLPEGPCTGCPVGGRGMQQLS